MYYVGYTSDYERRLKQHNESDKNTYTSKHRPWMIKTLFECGENEAEAIRLERFIKKQKSKKFLRKPVDAKDSKFTGALAQLVRVPNISG